MVVPTYVPVVYLGSGRHAAPAWKGNGLESKVSPPSVLPFLDDSSSSLTARDRDWTGLFACFVLPPWGYEGVALPSDEDPRSRFGVLETVCARHGGMGWVWLRRFGIKGWLAFSGHGSGRDHGFLYTWTVSSRR